MNELLTKSLTDRVDEAIRYAWGCIEADWEECFLFREGSLQCALYYHLRGCADKYFREEENIRIFSELDVRGQKIDLAVVALKRGEGEKLTYESSKLALIELKYGTCATSGARQDIGKLAGIGADQYERGYVAYIYEYSDKDTETVGGSDKIQVLSHHKSIV